MLTTSLTKCNGSQTPPVFGQNGRMLSIRPLTPARWPDLEEAALMRRTRVVLAAAHLDHDPGNNRLRNLKSLCHMIHDRLYHLAQRRLTYLLRRAIGDLFLGPIAGRQRLVRDKGRYH